MRPKLLIAGLVAAIAAPTHALAGKATGAVDPDYTNVFADLEPFEVDDIRVELTNAVARHQFVKLKARLVNDTDDFLLFYRNEARFEVNGEAVSPNGGQPMKVRVADPRKKLSATVEVSRESGGLQDETFGLELGGVYRVSTSKKVVSAPEFQLPASRNNFDAGDFSCNLTKAKQETGETWARFECVYRGDGVGVIDPSRVALRIPSGEEYANMDRKSDPKLALPGDKVKFSALFQVPGRVVDMQFATLHVVWHDTFVDAKALPVAIPAVSFVLDPAATAEAN